MAILQAGYNVVINQKVGGTNTPIYPFTKTANVVNAAGDNLDTVISGLAVADHGNHVPDFSSETKDGLRFLNNDNTWATIQSASTTQAGVVQLSDATNLEDSTVAATAKAVKLVKDAVDALGTTAGNTYVTKTQLGVASADGVTGVATLDTAGLIPSSQLPSYVDDVVEVAMASDLSSASLTVGGDPITPESGKIYVDAIGENASNKTYRYSGSRYVVISETLALGETSSTAFAGDKGKVAYDHSQEAHARVDATKTASSSNNGYIQINDADVLVYTHPTASGASATNPHGTTAADVGLGKVENKTGAEIRAELTSSEVETALGFTPQNAATAATSANDGVMTAAQAAKLDKCMETAVSAEEPTFAGNGIWFQIVTE